MQLLPTHMALVASQLLKMADCCLAAVVLKLQTELYLILQALGTWGDWASSTLQLLLEAASKLLHRTLQAGEILRPLCLLVLSSCCSKLYPAAGCPCLAGPVVGGMWLTPLSARMMSLSD